jgi:hypothetical protein
MLGIFCDNVMDCTVYRKIHAPNVFLGDYNIACIVVFLLSPVEDRNKRLDEKEHHVYHIRAIVVMTIEMIVAMLLFALHFTQFVLVLEIAWCSLAVMLLLGKGKNVFENKKGGSA